MAALLNSIMRGDEQQVSKILTVKARQLNKDKLGAYIDSFRDNVSRRERRSFLYIKVILS